MYSELKSVSFMGVSDPGEMFLSEKDLNAMEFNFLVRPTLEIHRHDECQISRSEGDEDDDEVSQVVDQDKQVVAVQEEDHKFDLLVSTLKLKIPTSVEEFRVIQDDDNGFKTPTFLDQKIPVTLKCPPAPRKPKSLPSTKKRKAHRRQRLFLDLSSEIESLFPPTLVADFGGKAKKKVRQ